MSGIFPGICKWSFSIFICRAVVTQVITGYLPIQILQLFLSCVPAVMIMLSSLQGYISWSQIQKSACTKVLWFTIWNIFFANVLSGSALYRLNYFLEPKEFPRVLAEAVPAQVIIMTSFLHKFNASFRDESGGIYFWFVDRLDNFLTILSLFPKLFL